MPEEDPGDVFVHHRGAVLDALLSDPSLDRPGEPPAAEPGVDPASPDVSAAPTGPSGSSGTPKASELINAILSGQSPPAARTVDFSDLPGATESEMAESRVLPPSTAPYK